MTSTDAKLNRSLWPLFIAAMIFLSPISANATESPVYLGLDADMSRDSALSGESIRRGIELAVDEINLLGGVLGRPLELVVRDHRGNPARGIDNIAEFSAMNDMVAVVGGIHTPVAMAELPVIHERQMLYLGPWAAGTGVVANGYEPNFVFRVSVRDEYAGEFMINEAFARGFQRPGLLLWQTAWGRSNEKAMVAALQRRGAQPAGIEWYNTGAKSVEKQLEALRRAGADVVMLVAQPAGGTLTVQNMASFAPADRLPIISHWGVTGGRFYEAVEDALEEIDLTFLQTYSFHEPTFPERAQQLMQAYCAKFDDCDMPGAIVAPVGTAHAYDLVHLLALAIQKAGTIDRMQVRQALEELERYQGLVRNYERPFTPNHHDALDITDFRLAEYDNDGSVVPLPSR